MTPLSQSRRRRSRRRGRCARSRHAATNAAAGSRRDRSNRRRRRPAAGGSRALSVTAHACVREGGALLGNPVHMEIVGRHHVHVVDAVRAGQQPPPIIVIADVVDPMVRAAERRRGSYGRQPRSPRQRLPVSWQRRKGQTRGHETLCASVRYDSVRRPATAGPIAIVPRVPAPPPGRRAPAPTTLAGIASWCPVSIGPPRRDRR
jgi:hypothetical protein